MSRTIKYESQAVHKALAHRAFHQRKVAAKKKNHSRKSKLAEIFRLLKDQD